MLTETAAEENVGYIVIIGGISIGGGGGAQLIRTT